MRPSRRTLVAVALAVLLAPALSLAHEGGIDARGTIAGISATEVVVRTANGEAKRFAVNERTEVRRGAAPAALADVHVGERAVVHARSTPAGPEAFSIRLPRETKSQN